MSTDEDKGTNLKSEEPVESPAIEDAPPLPKRGGHHEVNSETTDNVTETIIEEVKSETDDEHKPQLPRRPSTRIKSSEKGKKYGMKRSSVDDFEMESPILDKKHSFTAHDHHKKHEHHKQEEELLKDVNLDYLVKTRVRQVDTALSSLSPEWRESDDVFLTKVNANDQLIELFSEVQAGDFGNPNKQGVYSLVLKTAKIKSLYHETGTESAQMNSLIEKLGFSGEYEVKKKLSVALKVLDTETISALLVFIHYRLKSAELTVILGRLFEKVVMESKIFVFLLSRTIESNDQLALVKLYNEQQVNPVTHFRELLSSDEFWIGFHQKLNTLQVFDRLIEQIVVYGFHSITGTLAKYIVDPESVTDLVFEERLVQFNHEYEVLAKVAKLNNKVKDFENLRQLKKKQEKLGRELETKSGQYNELLNNYKQLNEERFNNESVIKKLEANNGTLRLKAAEHERKLNSLLSNFEVIKTNNDKNTEIDKLNENLRHDIDRLQRELDTLQKKIKKK